MRELFQSVIWPAIAGNVAWAFFTVLLQEWAECTPSYWPRLFLLGALAIYLCLDWMHTQSIQNKLRRWYWIGDLLLAPAIAALAIAAEAPVVGDGRWFLAAVFGASAISQLCGAWTSNDIPLYHKGNWKSRLSWLVLNTVAAGIAIGFGGNGNEWGWHLFGAEALVIVCWALAKPGNFQLFRWLRD